MSVDRRLSVTLQTFEIELKPGSRISEKTLKKRNNCAKMFFKKITLIMVFFPRLHNFPTQFASQFRTPLIRSKANYLGRKIERIVKTTPLPRLIAKIADLIHRLIVLIRYQKARVYDSFSHWKKRKRFHNRIKIIQPLEIKQGTRNLIHHAKSTIYSTFERISRKIHPHRNTQTGSTPPTETKTNPAQPTSPSSPQPTPLPSHRIFRFTTDYLKNFLSANEIEEWEHLKSSFSDPKQATSLQIFEAKEFLYRWAESKDSSTDSREKKLLDEIVESLKQNDKPSFFAKIIGFYEHQKKNATSHQQRLLCDELIQTCKVFLYKNPFFNVYFLLNFLEKQKIFEKELSEIRTQFQGKANQLRTTQEYPGDFLLDQGNKLASFQKRYHAEIEGELDGFQDFFPLHIATHLGQIHSHFRLIDQLIRSKTQEKDINGENSLPPSLPPKKSPFFHPEFAKTSGLIFTIGTGEGHRSAAAAIQSYAIAGGGDITVVDTSSGFWVKNHILTRVGSLIGKQWKPSDICNLTHKHQLYTLNNFFRKTGEGIKKIWGNGTGLGVQSPGMSEKVTHKLNLRTAILLQNPDYIVLTYGHDAHPILEIAEDLKIPVLFFATDLDTQLEKIFPNGYQSTHPRNTFFIPLNDPEVKKTCSCIPEEKIGYLMPVREAMLHQPTPEEVQALKRERGIDLTTPVVSFMGGSMGQEIPYLIELANNADYKEKLHCIIVAGKNTKLAKDIKRKLRKEQNEIYYKGINENITIEIAEHQLTDEEEKRNHPYFLSENEMAKVCQISDGVITTKMGGGTTFELYTQKLPIILDQTKNSFFPWEKRNFEILHKMGCATSFDDSSKFIDVLKEFLKTKSQKNPIPHVSTDSNQNILIQEVLKLINMPDQ